MDDAKNKMAETLAKARQYLMNTTNRYPLVFESGRDMYMTDENGREYLDFMSGVAVNCLGHTNELLVKAIIAEQAGKIIHTSNYYWNLPQVSLAEKLVENSCFDKVFFCNSGAEAIEACLKLARKYGSASGKYEIVSMYNSFHGRTYGALTATGQEKYHKGFEPMLPGFKYAVFNDIESLKNAVTDKTAAVLLEPVQGEGGIIPADKEYLRAARELCDEKGALLIFDEIQCGMGRTGSLFAYQSYGVEPDIMALAKGLGGGVPIGAALAKDKCAVFVPGEHASTFGGNPLATAAGCAVMDALLGGVLQNAFETGNYLGEKLTELKEKHGDIKDTRGVGLMRGIELGGPAAPVIDRCIENGLLLINAGANVVRLAPALIVTKADIDKAIGIISAAL